MSDESTDEAGSTTLGMKTEAEIRELMGMFDAPSFARRGQAMESSIARLHERCRLNRSQMLDMVRLRLKQWAQAVDGPDAWREVFKDPIDHLWPLSESERPTWSETSQPLRRRRTIARDLVASVERFNTRWTLRIRELNLAPINELIRQYNAFYVLEKECVLGSSRLAARFFRPEPELTPERLLVAHPLLLIPEML